MFISYVIGDIIYNASWSWGKEAEEKVNGL